MRRLTFVCALLVSLAPAVWAVPPTANDMEVTASFAVVTGISPDYSDPDSGESYTLQVASDPSHGSASGFGNKYYYTPDAGYSGPDSFTYTIYDGDETSNVATITITVEANTPPAGTDTKYISVNGSDADLPIVAIHVDDPNLKIGENAPGQLPTLELVDGPSHGAAVLTDATFDLWAPYPTFTYDPTDGYTGPDSFTYRINDGVDDSDVYTVDILVRSLGDFTGVTRLIIVDPELDGKVDDALNAVTTDMESKNLTVKKVVRSFSNDEDLRAFLNTEYHTDNQFIDGVILLGDFPDSDSDFDVAYWNVDHDGFSDKTGIMAAVIRRHFWVSRIHVGSSYGAEVMLANRYLRINHGVRTGAVRAPQQALIYNNSNVVNEAQMTSGINAAAEIWPTVVPSECTGDPGVRPADAMDMGGQWYSEISHGNGNSYDGGSFSTKSVMSRSTLYTLGMYNSCSSGRIGGVVNHHILTRGGACMFTFGAPNSAGGSSFRIDAYSGLVGVPSTVTRSIAANLRKRLSEGDTWGSALVDFYCFYNDSMCYGDLSVPASMFPSNTVPSLDSFDASTTSGNAPLSVNFSTSATDSDGSIVLYEYFFEGYDYGRNEPISSGAALTNPSHTYTIPHAYTARVEAVDNYGMRARSEKTITVGPRSDIPVRINCGATADQVDSNGKLWLRDQSYQSGTWGWSCGKVDDQSRSDSVSGTNDDFLFQIAQSTRNTDYPLTYKIPLDNGNYTLKLHFADLWSSSTTERVMDISIEGTQVLDAFSPYDDAGADTAITKEFPVTLTDGELTIVCEWDATTTERAFISAIEILPDAVLNPGTLSVADTAINVGEGDGNATITLCRSGGADGAVSIVLKTTDDSAIAGADYNAANTVAIWDRWRQQRQDRQHPHCG